MSDDEIAQAWRKHMPSAIKIAETRIAQSEARGKFFGGDDNPDWGDLCKMVVKATFVGAGIDVENRSEMQKQLDGRPDLMGSIITNAMAFAYILGRTHQEMIVIDLLDEGELDHLVDKRVAEREAEQDQ